MQNHLNKQAFEKLANANLVKANQFLETHAQAPGVIVMEGGKLLYEMMKAGEGATLKPHDKPMIYYTGQFLDGTVFGSSPNLGGSPVTISLNQMVPGFIKGITGMKEGEKRKIYIHPDLGFGERGELPPNSLLIFEIEIVRASSTP